MMQRTEKLTNPAATSTLLVKAGDPGPPTHTVQRQPTRTSNTFRASTAPRTFACVRKARPSLFRPR